MSARLLIAAAVAAAAVTSTAAGVVHLHRGDVPPGIDLTDLGGRHVRTADLAGRTVVLVFGELYHDKTLSACHDLYSATSEGALADRSIARLLIVGQDAPASALQERAVDAGPGWTVLQDRGRAEFGAYRVSVLPSVVVLDRGGRVVHAVAGYGERFKDVTTDAILVAEGLLGAEAFERTLHPDRDQADPAQARAGRLASLARQLADRGMDDAARAKYEEALAVVPGFAPARLGLAALLLRGGRLAEAEQGFRDVIAVEPHDLEARLGLAYVLVLRGGDELAEAETIVHAVLANRAGEPRAHYLAGMIHQQRGEVAEAAASFRAAAELLMNRRWDLVPAREVE